jgi:hypothetical protein
MPRTAEISTEAKTALQAYAEKHGRTWKSKLRAQWLRASAPAILHGLRNSHGPSWLNSFILPR